MAADGGAGSGQELALLVLGLLEPLLGPLGLLGQGGRRCVDGLECLDCTNYWNGLDTAAGNLGRG